MQDPAGGDFVWAKLQYVFPLSDPSTLRPAAVTITKEETAKLQRFVHVARQLAATTLLGAGDSVTISFSDDGSEAAVQTSLSAPDVTSGFMVLLRQCYANDEEASFAKVRTILMKSLTAANDVEMIEEVKRWGSAHSKLMNISLDELAQEKMQAEGVIPASVPGPDGSEVSFIVRGPAPPEKLLRTYWYGDQIHWGNYRDALELARGDDFDSATWDLAVRQTAADFAFFYGGMAVLTVQVLRATGDAD